VIETKVSIGRGVGRRNPELTFSHHTLACEAADNIDRQDVGGRYGFEQDSASAMGANAMGN
jgi:hypothetical protein